jgi:hypothetical protein
VKKTHDYTHRYRGYWSDGGRCRIRSYHEDGRAPVVICSQLPDNDNTSVTNIVEYLAAEIIRECSGALRCPPDLPLQTKPMPPSFLLTCVLQTTTVHMPLLNACSP